MKILQITSTFPPVIGGTEKVVYETAKKLVREGHEVTVLTTDLYFTNQEFKSEEKKDGIEIKRFKNKYWLGGYGYCPQLIDWLKENYQNYDIAHCQGFNRYASEFTLKYLANKIPTIFTPHGFIHTKKNNFAKKFHDLIMKSVIQKATYCTMLTQLDKEDYKRLGVVEEKLVTVPNGIDTKKYTKATQREREEFRKKYNITKPVILSVGRIHKSKGFQYIIEAIRDIDVQLLIIGPTSQYQGELEKIAKKNRVENKVIFTGPVSDKELVTAYNTGNTFVLASEWEGFGLVVIEAMAAGMPVIATRRGAIPYLIKDNKNGLLVEYQSIPELRSTIEDLISNPKKQMELIKEGLKTAGKYDWSKVAIENIKLYKRAMNEFGKT